MTIDRKPPTPTTQARERGTVLLLTLVVLVLVGGTVLALSATVQKRGVAAAETVWGSRAVYSAEAAIEYSRGELWGTYLAANGGTSTAIQAFREYLEFDSGLALADGGQIDVTSSIPDLGMNIERVTVRRSDVGTVATDLIWEVFLPGDRRDVALARSYRIEGETYNGLDFVLFSNNVNCIFCHAKFDSVQKYTSNEYPRVKVATVESLMLRSGSADSTIAGSLYVRGQLMDKSGNLLSGLEGTSLTGYKYDDTGMIMTDDSGHPIETDFVEGDNFFIEGGDATTAGDLTGVAESFPSSFPDENGNRAVDDAEYASVAAESVGSISGGLIHETALGSSYSGSGSPTAGTRSSVDQEANGNLVLIGTPDNPIEIDGQVAVPGDVVIKGVVKGSGSIWARGNVYIVGDIEYADGTTDDGRRNYGTADDGTTNALGLTAGGNILIGDYLTPKRGDLESTAAMVSGDPASGDFNFTLSEVTLFNRREWAMTQPTLPGTSGPVANPNYDPDKPPVYYVLNPGDPVGVFAGGKTQYDPSTNTWVGKEHAGSWSAVGTSIDPSMLPANAVISSLAPTGGWLTQTQLKEMWIEDEQARPSGTPFNIDALLYTSRSIFALSRKKSNTAGQLLINGGLVSGDMGILSAGGLELNYDQRVTDFLGIVDHAATQMTLNGTWVVNPLQ